jgi:hypothetical protein
MVVSICPIRQPVGATNLSSSHLTEVLQFNHADLDRDQQENREFWCLCAAFFWCIQLMLIFFSLAVL